jgi:hypothetical protein
MLGALPIALGHPGEAPLLAGCGRGLVVSQIITLYLTPVVWHAHGDVGEVPQDLAISRHRSPRERT